MDINPIDLKGNMGFKYFKIKRCQDYIISYT